MDISGLTSVTTASGMLTWLAQNCLTPISPVMTGTDLGTILQKIINVTSSGGTIPDATENNAGIIALATIAQALAGTDDVNAMTALKTLALILDQAKNVYYQIAPVSLNEVSFLMRNAGNVSAVTISGASNAKLKTGLAGTYPSGDQTFPFTYAAGDRIFVTYNYTDLNNASCNIILTCKDN
jgi:hypothetical protein